MRHCDGIRRKRGGTVQRPVTCPQCAAFSDFRQRHPGSNIVLQVANTAEIAQQVAGFELDMGVIEEPCPLGLTPSSSMAVMLAISDAVALALLEAKGVTREDYGLRHHGGYLGRAARTDNLPS